MQHAELIHNEQKNKIRPLATPLPCVCCGMSWPTHDGSEARRRQNDAANGRLCALEGKNIWRRRRRRGQIGSGADPERRCERV